MVKRFARDASTSKTLLGWRGVVRDEREAARGTPMPPMTRATGTDAWLKNSNAKSFAFAVSKENARPPVGDDEKGWDWNASVLENVGNGAASIGTPGNFKSGTRQSFRSGGSPRWNALSPVPLPSLDFSSFDGNGTSPSMGNQSPLSVSLVEKRNQLVSLDNQRQRVAEGTPVRGALDQAYKDVLAECAALEASVEAFETMPTFSFSGSFDSAKTQSRLGVSSLSSNAPSLDARLVDAGSRAAGLLERAEAMRKEMSDVSWETSGQNDWSFGGPKTVLKK